MKSVLAFACAAGIATAAAAHTQQTPSTGQDQQRQQGQAAQAAGQEITLTGCLYQASDAPSMFAIHRMESTQPRGSASTDQPPSSTNSKPAAGTDSQQGAANTPPGSSAQSHQPSSQSSASGQQTDGAWYRLTPGAVADLEQYAGQRVRVMGKMTPGRDERGADVVIHRIEPDKTVVTAIDLKPAPELTVSSVTRLEGACDQGSRNPDTQQQ